MTNEVEPERDAEGFLSDWQRWDEALARRWAEADGLILTPAHWELLQLARDYYSRYHVAPGMRILVALLRAAGEQTGEQSSSGGAPSGGAVAQQHDAARPQGAAKPAVDSRYLYRLFNVGSNSESPGRQVCRYAGLPKPVSCI